MPILRCSSSSAQEESLDAWLEETAATTSASSLQGHCYGCGVQLQTKNTLTAGFVEPDKYALKQRHRQLDQLLCGRCQELSNGSMIPGVADFAQSGARATGFADKALVTPEQLREQLRVVQHQRALVVLLVDLLDASGSILGRVRDLVGANPIILVGTKADLLPAGTDVAEVAEWLAAAADFRRMAVAAVHLVSARSGDGVARAVAALRQERRGRDVYVVGAANVGKSAFVRAFVKDMAKMSSRQYDPAALDKTNRLPVESAMPGTTLKSIPLQVFSAGGTLYDTPGVHLHHRTPHLLTPEENKLLHPRKRLKPYVAPSPADVAAAAPEAEPAGAQAASSSGEPELEGGKAMASYWWGGLVRIDVLACPPDMRLVFYGPPALRVAAGPGVAIASAAPPLAAARQGEGDSEQPAGGEGEPFGAASVAARGGMRVAKMISLEVGASMQEPLADVAVSGVPGWVAVLGAGRRGERIELRVLAPVGVEVYRRPPLPVASYMG